MKRGRLRILLADDHALVRAGTKAILSLNYDAEFVETNDAHETINVACNQARFDLILLDIGLQGRSGLDIVSDLVKCSRDTPILVLSAQDEEQFATRALRAGAAGYVAKADAVAELMKGIEKVLDGRHYVSERFAESLAVNVQRGTRPRSHESLSAREFEVLRMISAGKSGKEIAAELSISFKTVSTYRTRLMQKLNVHSNAELANYATREGLIQTVR